jgi:IstB-like ATP binding protein
MTMSQEIPTPTVVAPQVLLGNHLKALKLPTFAREYEKVAMESAQDRADYPRYLLRLCELERIDRERRNVERRIRLARFPQTKSLDTFDFTAQPSLNKALVLELARLANGSRSARTALRSGRPAPAKPTLPWHWGWPPARRATASPSRRPPLSCMNSWKRATNVACGRRKSISTRSNC